MKNNLQKQEAVINLHEKGFTDDFHLIGNDLLWVQGKTYLQREDFSVLEFYKFVEKDKAIVHSNLILGIQSLRHNTKGILIRHFTNEKSTGGLQSSFMKKNFISNDECFKISSTL